MNSDDAGLRPLDEEPKNVRPPFAQRPPEQPFDANTERWRAARLADHRAALLEALEGVELGEYDQRIVDWLAGWDVPTIGAVVSLFYRARQAQH